MIRGGGNYRGEVITGRLGVVAEVNILTKA